MINGIYIALFSVNAFCIVGAAALTGKNWSAINSTEKFVLACIIGMGWSQNMLALMHKLVAKEKQGKTLADDNGDTKPPFPEIKKP